MDTCAGFVITSLKDTVIGAKAPVKRQQGRVQIDHAALEAARKLLTQDKVGIARVPDPRVDRLSEIHKPKKTTHATVEYVDLAGVAKGEAADALPLEQLRTVDARAHVVRGFRDESIPHAEGTIEPPRDASTMETELILADHTIAERRREKLEALVRKTNKDEDNKELETLERCVLALEREVPLRNLDLSETSCAA